MVETIPNNCGTTRHLSQQINDTLIASQRIGLGSPKGCHLEFIPHRLSRAEQRPPGRSLATQSRGLLGRNKRPPGRNKRLQAATSGHQAATWPRASVGQKKKRKSPGREKKGREQFITSLCSEGGQLLVVHLSFVRNLLFFKNKIFNRKK